MPESEESVQARMTLSAKLNNNPRTREQLEAEFGKGNVWDVDEFSRDFRASGFLAPFVVVTRKEKAPEEKAAEAMMTEPPVRRYSLTFQHRPRFYFDLVEDV